MSDPDAFQDEMRRLPLGELRVDPLALDGDTAYRLLAGRLDPADAPLPGPVRWMVDSVSRAARHLPARSAVDRQDPGEVRSGGRGQDGAASVGHAGAVKAHVGRSAPAAPTGPDATGAARDGHRAPNLAGRVGVNGCKDVRKVEPEQQGGHGSAAQVTPATGASGANHRQKEGGSPGPEGGHH